MSLATWKKKYYPVAADKISEVDAATHSLQKWKGLRPAVLRRHGVQVSRYGKLTDKECIGLLIDDASCSLYKFYNENACPNCPLSQFLGERCDREEQPFRVWGDEHDPEPMITALEAVVAKQKKGEL